MIETQKLQVATLIDESTKTYDTDVFPTTKKSPEECVLISRESLPDASTAEGSFQVIMDPYDPDSMVLSILDGQSKISGDFVSTIKIEKEDY